MGTWNSPSRILGAETRLHSTNTRSVDYFEFAQRHCETLDGCSTSTRRTEERMVKGKLIVDRNWEQRVYVVYVVTAGCSTRCVFQPLLPGLPLSEPKYEWQLILVDIS